MTKNESTFTVYDKLAIINEAEQFRITQPPLLGSKSLNKSGTTPSFAAVWHRPFCRRILVVTVQAG